MKENTKLYATQSDQPNLVTAHFTRDFVEATNGRRLARVELRAPLILQDVSQLKKNKYVSICFDKEWVFIRYSDLLCIAKLEWGVCPCYYSGPWVSINRETLLEALGPAKAMPKLVLLEFSSGVCLHVARQNGKEDYVVNLSIHARSGRKPGGVLVDANCFLQAIKDAPMSIVELRYGSSKKRSCDKNILLRIKSGGYTACIM